MTDIADGCTLEFKGSGAKPYVLKNVGGVYSCSCPAWRNQSIGIERRTCKHLKKVRGEAAEAARCSGLPGPVVLPVSDEEAQDLAVAVLSQVKGTTPPPILLAESWDGVQDPTGWWMSEKLDGVRAYWDGTKFLSRLGNVYHAPKSFLDIMPKGVVLDGELWLGRKKFQQTVSIVRRQDANEDVWKDIVYKVFDVPDPALPFERRILQCIATAGDCMDLRVHALHQFPCTGIGHLRQKLAEIEALGGEGLMLRQPGSLYVAGRSPTLLKVKSFFDAEAKVTGYTAGKGRHKGVVGALEVELPNGTKFAVGTGLTDQDRKTPPKIGSKITFRYQELSDGGVPRFPSYVGVRLD